ncbi:MAG: hypothetical protein IKT52_00315 [Oscillospiraceae bacterium]|nr:hypothetical protein [Oscillospiraceae bacterium]
MKASKRLKALFGLTLLTLCLPWFTYNARVMGYRYGFAFLKWFLVPLAILALCLYWPKRSRILIVLGEAAHISNFTAIFTALGLWQQVCNIKSGFHLLEGIRTAQPGYWMAVGFFVIFFVCFQIELIKDAAKPAQKAFD